MLRNRLLNLPEHGLWLPNLSVTTTRNYEHVSLYFTMKEAFLLLWTGHALCLAGEQVSASALIMDARTRIKYTVLEC